MIENMVVGLAGVAVVEHSRTTTTACFIRRLSGRGGIRLREGHRHVTWEPTGFEFPGDWRSWSSFEVWQSLRKRVRLLQWTQATSIRMPDRKQPAAHHALPCWPNVRWKFHEHSKRSNFIKFICYLILVICRSMAHGLQGCCGRLGTCKANKPYRFIVANPHMSSHDRSRSEHVRTL